MINIKHLTKEYPQKNSICLTVYIYSVRQLHSFKATYIHLLFTTDQVRGESLAHCPRALLNRNNAVGGKAQKHYYTELSLNAKNSFVS